MGNYIFLIYNSIYTHSMFLILLFNGFDTTYTPSCTFRLPKIGEI